MWFYKSTFVLILAGVTINVSADYFLSNGSTDWGLANCSLAEPKLSYIDDSFQINETLGVHNNVSEVWIGFQQAKIPFLFIGCGELNTNFTYNVTTIGFCYNLCGGFFGIKALDDVVLSKSTLECKCPNGSSATNSQNCIPSANNMCGKKCYSIYGQFNLNESYVTNPKNATEDCLTYYYPYFRWEPCKMAEYKKVMCSNYIYEDVKSTALIVSKMATSWVEGMALCIKEGLYPASPRSIMNSGFNSTHLQYYWTGVIRANTLLPKYPIETETSSISPSTFSVQPANTSTQFSSTTGLTTVPTCETKQDTQDQVHQSKTSNRDFLAIGVGIGIPIGIILAVGGVVAMGCLRKRGVLSCGKIKLTDGQSNERQEMNYEDMVERNERNESYCVLDGNVDSEERTVSYVNQQNDLNGTYNSSSYYKSYYVLGRIVDSDEGTVGII
ncbi:uncharacterized protein LOC127861186 isoform X2 [Dreissena polymorpha]|uniref:uncharacterized protein LOC127861186 isoform X2 n=1 Tax=Dreissena polymorpha TaxID=45954 RepID=UPI0022649538|nr:uncharacterized protein LOC127861186 isoform X2 [Dreissena polymorpha]